MSLDPQTNREERALREAEEREAVEPRLNAPFPFERLRFDPFFFGVEEEVEGKLMGES